MLEKLEKSQWDGLEELEDIIEVRGYDPKAISAYFWRHPGPVSYTHLTLPTIPLV